MYIGKTPATGAFQKCDAISTSATATFNLTVGSVAVSPETANHCIVSLNGVIQAPTSAYTIVGSTIVFASTLTTTDVIDFILILGNVLDIGTPSDDAVTLAKMASGTDGNIISYDTSGNPVAVATGTDGQVLTSSGAGAVCAFETLSAGKIGQIVSTLKTDTFTSTNSTAWNDITGMTVAITPAAASSKILICWNLFAQAKTNNKGNMKMMRDIDGDGYADFAVGDASSSRLRVTMASALLSTDNPEIMSAMVLDSPSYTLTDEITYKGQIWSDSDWMGVNRSYGDTDGGSFPRGISTMTAMEVLA